MSFATDMRLMASELATDLGNSATFKDKTTNTYDNTTGKTTVVTADQAVKVGGPFGYDPRLIDGDTVLESDAKIILSAEGLTWTPDVNELVVIDSRTWTIVKVEPLKAQDVTVAWEIQIR